MENKNIRYILDNIISKARFNKENNTYEIKEEDYLHLNLTAKQKRLLILMCKNLGITLEFTPFKRQILPCIEDETLFNEYNCILDKLSSDLTEEERMLYEQRRINLRNKIATDNMILVNAIIDRRLDKDNNINNLDDIYQTSYEILLEYIDNNYLYVGKFKNHISHILLIHTERRILYDNERLGIYTKGHIQEISKEKEPINLEELSKKLNLPIKRTKELLNIDNILTSLSLEEQISLINSQEDNEQSLLYTDPFEIDLITKHRKDTILEVLSTLSKLEQELITLYFGLNGYSYTEQEIANIYGTTRKYISLVINQAIRTIKTSIRINYLKEVYEVPVTYQEQVHSSNKTLEEFLIRHLSNETIDLLTPHLEEDVLKFLNLYTKHHEYKLKELGEALSISTAGAYKLKLKTLSSIKFIISNIVNQNNQQKITYEEYLDYLMQLYFHKEKIKRKVRNHGII